MGEIAKILGVDNATTATPGWFAARTPAIKNIIAQMTAAEVTDLSTKVEEIAKNGYSLNLQRR